MGGIRMKIKIIKKMLSVLLTISSLVTFTFFVSAEGGDQHDLESQMAECNQIIEECNKTILYFEKEKDSNIESINNELRSLDEIKKILDAGEEIGCNGQYLETQNKNLLEKIEDIKRNYQNDIKLACEIKQQQINKKAKFQKKLGEIKKKEKNSEQNIDDLIQKGQILGIKFRALSPIDKGKLDQSRRIALLNFPKKCRRLYQNSPLSKDEFNRLQAEFNDLKTKVYEICENKKSPNEFKNLQTKSGASDQSQKNTNLWQKINSGAQYYKPNHVAENLCWLHSAINVRNYYNNIKNKGIVKGQTAIVQEYRQIMGDQAAANNINGSMQEFNSIAEYLQKCGLGSFQIIISSSSNNAQQKIKDTAKELLKAQFDKIQNTSPVISHAGGSRGHFITIADYDQNQDQFLIVDSSADQSIEARVVWRKSEEFLQALVKRGFSGEHTLELDFTSDASGSRSIGLTVNENNSITRRNFSTKNEQDTQTSIYALKNMIGHY